MIFSLILSQTLLARFSFKAERGKCAAHTDGWHMLEEQSYFLFILALNHSPVADKGQCGGLTCWDGQFLPAFEWAERGFNSYRRPIALHKTPLMLWTKLVLVNGANFSSWGKSKFSYGTRIFLGKKWRFFFSSCLTVTDTNREERHPQAFSESFQEQTKRR